MNGSHLRVASHLETLAYCIQRLCGYSLPQVAIKLFKHIPLDPWQDLNHRPLDLQPSVLPSVLWYLFMLSTSLFDGSK